MPKKEVTPFGETALEDMSFSEMLDIGVIDIAEVDDVIAVDQAELVGKPMILFEWDIKPSAMYGGSYALCRVKTEDGTRVFADGGTGIQEQLERYKNKLAKLDVNEFSPMYFHYGLRASHYNKEVDGNVVAATTYYFDNRPRP
jgi:hypothetical protein